MSMDLTRKNLSFLSSPMRQIQTNLVFLGADWSKVVMNQTNCQIFCRNYFTCLQTRRSPATLMFVIEHFSLNASRASARAVSFFMACCACNGKGLFTLSESESEHKSEFLFDLCRSSTWTFNCIFYKPIWNRCHFHFRFRTKINEL